MIENRQWILVTKPEGLVEQRHLRFAAAPVGEPGPGQVLLRNVYHSLDPGQQFYMSSSADVGGGTLRPGDVITGWTVGQVMASNAPEFPVGSYARERYGKAGMQDYSILPAGSLARVDPDLAPLPAQLGVLGMPGLTAYFGLIDIGRPLQGQTVVVSGAAGAVGSVVGQLAHVQGCRAVGIAGGEEKCRYVVEELGFDACVNYRAADMQDALRAACPGGIDVYFDNVGGRILDVCLSMLALRGRVVSCGAIAEYGTVGEWQGLRNYMSILVNGGRWEGLSIHNYYDRYDEAFAALEGWFREGRLQHREDVAVGLENFLPQFHRLFTGANRGKLVLQARDGITH